jgi:hypothetical protein
MMRGAVNGSSRDPASPLLHIDVALVVGVLAIAVMGLLMVFSATFSPRAIEKDTSSSTGRPS